MGPRGKCGIELQSAHERQRSPKGRFSGRAPAKLRVGWPVACVCPAGLPTHHPCWSRTNFSYPLWIMSVGSDSFSLSTHLYPLEPNRAGIALPNVSLRRSCQLNLWKLCESGFENGRNQYQRTDGCRS